jgi:15-cis-phytoene synthase
MTRHDPPDDDARELQASRTHCHRVARAAGSSFYPCFALLDRPKREAMEALYAFLRHTDDLADSPQPLDARHQAVAVWREAVTAAIGKEGSGFGVQDRTDRPPSDPVHHSSLIIHHFQLLPALAAAVRQFHIPPEHLLAAIDGVQMDLDGRRYETFDELADYCDRVASAVGLACIYIWGFRGPEALDPARQCGRAFQLTNILRDLKEDAAAGRIYLPAEDLRHCGYSAEELHRGVINPGFHRLLDMEIARARELYRRGVVLMDQLDPSGHRIFGMMVSVYYQLLCKIERQRAGVLTHRIRLSRWQKLRLAARWFLLPPRRLVIP